MYHCDPGNRLGSNLLGYLPAYHKFSAAMDPQLSQRFKTPLPPRFPVDRFYEARRGDMVCEKHTYSIASDRVRGVYSAHTGTRRARNRRILVGSR